MFLVSFYNHARAVGAAAGALGIEVSVDLADFSLRVQAPSGAQTWRPQFLANFPGGQAYVHTPPQHPAGFAGWVPYALRQWPIAGDKLAFKHRADAQGVPTPAACRDLQQVGGPFLVKHAHSSFGQGMRGPFLRRDESAEAQRLREGEYYENFLVGLIAKAWCWGDRCVALELQAPTVVSGDGKAPLRELVAALPDTRTQAHDWALISRLARYCGIDSLDAAPAAGKEVLVEFRYGSRYRVPSRTNTNVLPRLADASLREQFDRAARIFSRAIPPQQGVPESLFTLDAIVEADGRARFLEMNCSPLAHPDAYAPMLASACVFSGASTAPMPPRNRSATTGAIAS